VTHYDGERKIIDFAGNISEEMHKDLDAVIEKYYPGV
jgi:hypothetical protein